MAAASATTWRSEHPEKIKNVVGKDSFKNKSWKSSMQTIKPFANVDEHICKCPSPCCTFEHNLNPLVLLVIVATCAQKMPGK